MVAPAETKQKFTCWGCGKFYWEDMSCAISDAECPACKRLRETREFYGQPGNNRREPERWRGGQRRQGLEEMQGTWCGGDPTGLGRWWRWYRYKGNSYNNFRVDYKDERRLIDRVAKEQEVERRKAVSHATCND